MNCASEFVILSFSSLAHGILWCGWPVAPLPLHLFSHVVALSHRCSHLLTSAHICSHLLTSAHICSHLLTSAHTCSHLLTPVYLCPFPLLTFVVPRFRLGPPRARVAVLHGLPTPYDEYTRSMVEAIRWNILDTVYCILYTEEYLILSSERAQCPCTDQISS